MYNVRKGAGTMTVEKTFRDELALSVPRKNLEQSFENVTELHKFGVAVLAEPDLPIPTDYVEMIKLSMRIDVALRYMYADMFLAERQASVHKSRI